MLQREYAQTCEPRRSRPLLTIQATFGRLHLFQLRASPPAGNGRPERGKKRCAPALTSFSAARVWRWRRRSPRICGDRSRSRPISGKDWVFAFAEPERRSCRDRRAEPGFSPRKSRMRGSAEVEIVAARKGTSHYPRTARRRGARTPDRRPRCELEAPLIGFTRARRICARWPAIVDGSSSAGVEHRCARLGLQPAYCSMFRRDLLDPSASQPPRAQPGEAQSAKTDDTRIISLLVQAHFNLSCRSRLRLLKLLVDGSHPDRPASQTTPHHTQLLGAFTAL